MTKNDESNNIIIYCILNYDVKDKSRGIGAWKSIIPEMKSCCFAGAVKENKQNKGLHILSEEK